jgi:FAD/FMN-containing dehydrogenase
MTETGIATSAEDLAAQLKGTLIRPEDAGYDEARALYNAMIDKRPALIVRAAGVADVVAAVNYGREQGLDIAIRGGGHNGAGLASVDDGLVIDLSAMNGVEIDAANRTVEIGGGPSAVSVVLAPIGSNWKVLGLLDS